MWTMFYTCEAFKNRTYAHHIHDDWRVASLMDTAKAMNLKDYSVVHLDDFCGPYLELRADGVTLTLMKDPL